MEPTEHRPPIPESVTFAMVSLAWLWGWKRWAAVTLYTFSAISWVGEVLRARRMDALTPRDILFEQHVIYLKVNFPKTRHRGPRVQYSSAEWDTCVSLVSKVWDELMPDEFLFPGSQAAYRFRWDALLKHLKISSSFKLTPGSLRGGRCGFSAPEESCHRTDHVEDENCPHEDINFLLTRSCSKFDFAAADCKSEKRYSAVKGLDASADTTLRPVAHNCSVFQHFTSCKPGMLWIQRIWAGP